MPTRPVLFKGYSSGTVLSSQRPFDSPHFIIGAPIKAQGFVSSPVLMPTVGDSAYTANSSMGWNYFQVSSAGTNQYPAPINQYNINVDLSEEQSYPRFIQTVQDTNPSHDGSFFDTYANQSFPGFYDSGSTYLGTQLGAGYYSTFHGQDLMLNLALSRPDADHIGFKAQFNSQLQTLDNNYFYSYYSRLRYKIAEVVTEVPCAATEQVAATGYTGNTFGALQPIPVDSQLARFYRQVWGATFMVPLTNQPIYFQCGNEFGEWTSWQRYSVIPRARFKPTYYNYGRFSVDAAESETPFAAVSELHYDWYVGTQSTGLEGESPLRTPAPVYSTDPYSLFNAEQIKNGPSNLGVLDFYKSSSRSTADGLHYVRLVLIQNDSARGYDTATTYEDSVYRSQVYVDVQGNVSPLNQMKPVKAAATGNTPLLLDWNGNIITRTSKGTVPNTFYASLAFRGDNSSGALQWMMAWRYRTTPTLEKRWILFSYDDAQGWQEMNPTPFDGLSPDGWPFRYVRICALSDSGVAACGMAYDPAFVGNVAPDIYAAVTHDGAQWSDLVKVGTMGAQGNVADIAQQQGADSARLIISDGTSFHRYSDDFGATWPGGLG